MKVVHVQIENLSVAPSAGMVTFCDFRLLLLRCQENENKSTVVLNQYGNYIRVIYFKMKFTRYLYTVGSVKLPYKNDESRMVCMCT